MLVYVIYLVVLLVKNVVVSEDGMVKIAGVTGKILYTGEKTYG